MKLWKRNCKQFYVGLFCFLTAAVLLMICSKSSPLYPFNDWPDVNMFITMGKGMLHGRVPFVDLLEQKGPYAYAAGGIAYLISPRGFAGYFLLELAGMFSFLFYAYQTIRLYTDEPALWVLPLLSTGVVSAKSFVHGGSLEELSLGIFAYAIYSLLSFLKDVDKDSMPTAVLALNGMWAGILFWSKFTLLGLYMAWVIVVAAEFLHRKKWKDCVRSVGIFLGAMFATTIPWLIYFGVHHAIGAWLQAYLWDNIFGYAKWGETSLAGKFWAAILNMLRSLKDKGNFSYSLLVAQGAVSYVCLPAKTAAWKEKFTVAFMGICMGVGIFIGETKHDYYGLPLAVFSMFGGVGLSVLPNRWIQRLQTSFEKMANPVYAVFLTLVLAAGACAAYRISPNTELLSVKREQMPQFRFAERMADASDRTLLNYGFLDGGFYTVLGEVPNVRAYCILNRNSIAMLEEQNEYVREGKTQFVVTWKAYRASEEELVALPVVSDYYDLVDYLYFAFEGDMRTYALYEKKHTLYH